MPDSSFTNRAMFWRILRRLLSDNPGRLAVMLLALGAGAAITAALLNLQVDARRRLTTEFRAFGPNVVISSREVDLGQGTTLDQRTAEQLRPMHGVQPASGSAVLFALVQAARTDSGNYMPVVLRGVEQLDFKNAMPTDILSRLMPAEILSQLKCQAGQTAAHQLLVGTGDVITIRSQGRETSCRVSAVTSLGDASDNQITLTLAAAQTLANLPDRLSLIELRVDGTPAMIQGFVSNAAERFPQAEVRPIRQFTEGEAKIYNRISGVLTATVAVVLVLTALCVMAAMTNVAMERKNDVGLMKAIGGATRRVLRLFLMEAALLGLTSGLLGAALGIVLSMWLGKAVFGLAARPRLIVYPVAVALTIIVAIAGAFPLRRLANIRPASVFRGEA